MKSDFQTGTLIIITFFFFFFFGCCPCSPPASFTHIADTVLPCCLYQTSRSHLNLTLIKAPSQYLGCVCVYVCVRVNGNIEGEQVRGALLGRAQGAEVEMWVIRFMAAGVAHAKFFCFCFFPVLFCFSYSSDLK